MDSKERRLLILLLSTAFSVMLSGSFYVYFMAYIWRSITKLIYFPEKSSTIALIFLVYFAMFALIGAAIGLIINHYVNKRIDRKLV